MSSLLTKTKEFIQRDNDIYFIQTISDKIIINDNYVGILILDNNLNIIRKLRIFEGIIVYNSFVNSVNEEVLLFCPDNECMVYVNLINYEYKVIYIKNELQSLIFSNIYEWNENGLVLTTYKGEFYNICINGKSIHKIDYKDAIKMYAKLYKIFQESKKHKVFKVFSNENIVIMDYDESNISIFNYKDKTKRILNSVTLDFIDINYRQGILTLVNENKVEIITNNDKSIIYPEEDYIFLQVRIIRKLNRFFLIVLSSSKSSASFSRVEMFQLYY